MKQIIKILILGMCITYSYSAENNYKTDIKYYDSIFNAINKAREGLTAEQLSNIVSPFYMKKDIILNKSSDNNSTSISDNKQSLTLYAIINNTAKINNQWYVRGDNLYGYKIKHIGKSSVILYNQSTKTKLDLKINNKGNNNVFISYK